VGSNNGFSPAPQDQGQPTTFEPGRSPEWPSNAFNVTFTGTALSWTLNGITVTADVNTPPCAYRIFVEKAWFDLRGRPINVPANLPSNFYLEAVSSLGTAVCNYPTGSTTLTCTYTNNMPPANDNNGLWVRPGDTYTVTEYNLPSGSSIISGTGIFSPTDGYCVPGRDGVERFCTHTVRNRVSRL
jgi:hypothetical protein